MLEQLLDSFNRKEMISLQELADSLRTNPETVKVGLEYLERQGYIKKAAVPSCRGKSCHCCRGCGSEIVSPVMWEIE
jgi:predicted ArsR family transcriptional regulator